MQQRQLIPGTIVLIVISALVIKLFAEKKPLTMLPYKAGDPFNAEWQKVDALVNKGLPADALEVAKGIQEIAKSTNNYAQQVKAIAYILRLQYTNGEDEQKNQIAALETEVAAARYPVKPVLQSMLAELYWNYYATNQYLLYNRTVTPGDTSSDIDTWDADRILKRTGALYEESLQPADSLQRTPLQVFDSVLVLMPGSKNFRKTLYDLLAHRALDFYMDSRSSLTEPANIFTVKDSRYLGTADDFLAIRPAMDDSASLKLKAILLLQQLTRFHQQYGDVNSQVDLELKRLQFMADNADIPIKDSLYIEALASLESNSLQDTISTMVSYSLARKLNEMAAGYDSITSPQLKMYYVKAVEKCNAAITRFKTSTAGAYNCAILKRDLLATHISLKSDLVIAPEKEFKFLQHYTNTDSVYLRIVSAKNIDEKAERAKGENVLTKTVLAQPALKEWAAATPGSADLRQHSTELAAPALKKGTYYLISSPTRNFNFTDSIVAYLKINVSNIGYISRTHSNGEEYYVHNRLTGQPLKGATVMAFNQQYNYTTRSYKEVNIGTFVTDADGRFIITQGSSYTDRQVALSIKYKDDILYTGDFNYIYPNNYNEEDKWKESTVFFTDRAIYRPGQTVFFKGLALTARRGESKIQKGITRTVTLVDVNGQEVTRQKFTTNSYGTFSGSFTLPSTGLNGTMSLQAMNDEGASDYKIFRVEDYKRPQFETTFNPVKGSFKLDDKVTVTGKALNYSGAAVDGARVTYRVARSITYPYWMDYYIWPPYYSGEKEIISGETVTDENGEFAINFTAIGDPAENRSRLPEYNFTVTADVTDMGGETQSTSTTVNVGTVALRVNVGFQKSYSSASTDSIDINTQNLNGEFEPAQGTITIYRLKDPGVITRPRLWSQPDVYSIGEQEFRKRFPNDIYKDEDRFKNWQRGPRVMQLSFNTANQRKFLLQQLSTWDQGVYAADVKTADKYGKEIKLAQYFTVYNLQKKEMPYTALWWQQPVKSTVEPGQAAQVLIGSSEKNVLVWYEVLLDGQVIKKEKITLNNEKRLIELPVADSYRGNVTMSFMACRNERVMGEAQLITVPYSNKKLDVSFSTFRDKILPGAKEQWKVKITGVAGEKVAAEMLAGMYDASLDAFETNSWNLDIYNERPVFANGIGQWQQRDAYTIANGPEQRQNYIPYTGYKNYGHDALDWFGLNIYYTYRNSRPTLRFAAYSGAFKNIEQLEELDATGDEYYKDGGDFKYTPAAPGLDGLAATETYAVSIPPPPVRTNFAETAFFYPQLETDTSGSISFSFTAPEALTRWKVMALAHTQDLKTGLLIKETVTQKDLMVMPNKPRFLREGDELEFTAKINSLADEDLTGRAALSFIDPITNKDVSALFGAALKEQSFNVKRGQSSTVSWHIKVPEGLSMVNYHITAAAGTFSDGEEGPLPVLTNRMLVTETLPVDVKGGQQKTLKLEKLINNRSATLRNHRLTFELSSNPAWYAIQALPYIMEYPYECSEQLFNRYYANTLAAHVANSTPRIKQVFAAWKNGDALTSNLEKNKDLKQLLLEETPWVMQGRDETERKKRIGLLFDLNKMGNEQYAALKKLRENQTANGGWAWFKGMRDDRFITQYIVSGIGRLNNLGAIALEKDNELQQSANAAIAYLDARIAEDYAELIKNKVDLELQQPGDLQVQYLYARSFFKQNNFEGKSRTAYDYYLKQAQKYWVQQSKYSQAMIAAVMYRYGDEKTCNDILRSLKQTAIVNEELGMYWKDNTPGYYWYQAPIETQAMMIEAFSLGGKNETVVDDLRTWLIRQKQVQDWKTTKATADACYALLLRGNDWLSTTEVPQVTIGNIKIEPGKNAPKEEAGTGYLRTSWSGTEIQPAMGTVTIKKETKGVAWGALYWQYFEQLDKITPAKTPLQLVKKLYLQTNSATGPVLTAVDKTTALKPGDLIKVRIELRVDRDMDFVQMKDMRASALEPVTTLSGYRYQGGLGYYESPRDASTNFFFDHIRRGTYIFEYGLRVSQKGNFSNGITTIQSMYAPEFTSHSEGIRVSVK